MSRATSDSHLGALVSSAICAFLLAIYPMPVWLQPARPDWLGLFVLYWTLRIPERFGMGWAWLAGLLLDGVTGGVLAKHALALATIAYITLVLRSRLLLYTIPQQAAVVFLLTAVDQMLCHWVQNVSGHTTPSWLFLVGSLSSALIWPLLMLGDTRERNMDSWGPSA